MKIEKGIPAPNHRKKYDYQWMKNLAVGDSFVVESRYLATQHMSWASRNLGYKFVSKLTECSTGIRVWRIK